MVSAGMKTGPSTTSLSASAWIQGIADPVRLKLLYSLASLGSATVTELAEHASSSHATIRRHLVSMVALGIVLETPQDADGSSGRPAVEYKLPPAVRLSVEGVLRFGA
jgi:DNA-binding transcriptional ArsR family regulator